MKKALFILIIVLFSGTSFSQELSNDIPDKHKFDYFYLKERYVMNNKSVLSIFDFTKKEEVRLDILDENLVEVKSITIPYPANADWFQYKVEGSVLYIINDFDKPKKNPGIEIRRIDLDGTYSIKKFVLKNASTIIPDVSNESFYYKELETGNLIKFNLETKEETEIDLNSESNDAVTFSEMMTFQNTSELVITTVKDTEKFELDAYNVGLYNDEGQEESSFNRLESGNYKAEVFFANTQGEIITSGNFVNDPTVDDVFPGRSAKAATKRREYDGIYIRTLKADKAIEKYYDYSAFPSLFSAINADKKGAKSIKNFTYIMEDIIKVNGEYVAIGTVNELDYARTVDAGPIATEFTGTTLKYILIYGFNSEGEITWEKIITPDLYFTRSKYDRIYDLAEAGDLITISEIENKIECHFSLIEKIHYFEIIDKEIVNYKKTAYQFTIGSNRLRDKNEIDLDQFKDSFYWYDNFYCSYLGGFTDKHTLYNRTEF